MPEAGDPETLTRARGALFVVTDRHGNVVPPGARELGLFRRDTRHLSHWELRTLKGQFAHLSSDASGEAINQIDLMVADRESSEFMDDPRNFLHIRRRQILDDGFAEEITLTNYLGRPLELSLELAFGVDFADIFEVRGAQRPFRGTMAPPRVSATTATFAYRGLCGDEYRTAVNFRTPPTTLSANRAGFELAFDVNEIQTLVVEVHPSMGGPKKIVFDPFAQRATRLLEDAGKKRAAATAIGCDDPLLQNVLDRAVSDLHGLMVTVGEHRIIGAGLPWFCAPFGRDALLTAYSLLTLNPDFAVDALRTLAAFQGKRVTKLTEEEPGKILHELRFGEMTKTRETPHAPYYGSIDATPLFVILLSATYEFLGDLELLRELRPALEGALGWIDARSKDGSDLVTYARKTAKGIENQCWKDSRAGVSSPDGRRAVAPVAVCEVQGYCIDAYRRGARLLAALGEKSLGDRYAKRASAMQGMFEERFWLPKKNRYAYAIDGEGEVLDTIVSNAGHLLWSGVVPPDRARAVADLLLSDASFSGFGIRTLSAGQAVYNPLSYHNGTIWPHDNAIVSRGLAAYGLAREVLTVFEGLHAAMGHFRDHRLPELFCGIARADGPVVRYPVACSPQAWAAATPFLLLQSALGIEADAPARRLVVRNPQLPPFLRRVELRRMRVGTSLVSMRFRRVAKRCHVEALEVEGPPLRVQIDLD